MSFTYADRLSVFSNMRANSVKFLKKFGCLYFHDESFSFSKAFPQ